MALTLTILTAEPPDALSRPLDGLSRDDPGRWANWLGTSLPDEAPKCIIGIPRGIDVLLEGYDGIPQGLLRPTVQPLGPSEESLVEWRIAGESILADLSIPLALLARDLRLLSRSGRIVIGTPP